MSSRGINEVLWNFCRIQTVKGLIIYEHCQKIIGWIIWLKKCIVLKKCNLKSRGVLKCILTMLMLFFFFWIAGNSEPEHEKASDLARSLEYGWKRCRVTKFTCLPGALNISNHPHFSNDLDCFNFSSWIFQCHSRLLWGPATQYPWPISLFRAPSGYKTYLFLGDRPEPWIKAYGLEWYKCLFSCNVLHKLQPVVVYLALIMT